MENAIFIESITRSIFDSIQNFVVTQVSAHWLSFAISLGIILAIIVIQSIGWYRFSSGVNSVIGSIVYHVLFWSLVALCYWIFGTQIIDEIWLILFWAIGYRFTKVLLKSVGFWLY